MCRIVNLRVMLCDAVLVKQRRGEERGQGMARVVQLVGSAFQVQQCGLQDTKRTPPCNSWLECIQYRSDAINALT